MIIYISNYWIYIYFNCINFSNEKLTKYQKCQIKKYNIERIYFTFPLKLEMISRHNEIKYTARGT